MEKFKTKTLKVNGQSFDVVVSEETSKIWLTVDQISKLINRSKSTTWRYISSTYNEINNQNSDGVSNSVIHHIKMTTLNDNVLKNQPNIYNILFVSELVNKYVPELNESLSNIISKNTITNNDDSNIIIYDNGSVHLNIKLSLEEDTVWLTQEQIALLFDTTQPNVSMHINNILKDLELDDSVYKDFLYTASDGKHYLTTFYNLDLILAVGYRVKSKRAIAFRKWVTSVLKQYLLKGIVVDVEKIKALENKYSDLQEQLSLAEIDLNNLKANKDLSSEFIFESGKYYDAYEFMCHLFEKAETNIVVIDPYFDNSAMKYLKSAKKNITKKIYLTHKELLSCDNVQMFRKQYGPLNVYVTQKIHDRFVIIDSNECYCVGTSLNRIGRKITCVNRITSIEIINALLSEITSSKVLY